MFVFSGWFLVLVLSIAWTLSYPRWEMVVEDLVGKVLLLNAHIHCLKENQRVCSTEQTLMALRHIYNPKGPEAFENSEEYIFEWHNYTARDGVSIPLFTARPKHVPTDARLPILLEFHLGGHVIGDATDLKVSALLANTHKFGPSGKFLVFSPAYRLAPEWKFPTAPNDCMDALLWVRKNAKMWWGGDLENIFLAGTSAGGNLAAATSHTVFEFPEKYGRVKGQILFIPITDFHAASNSFATHWNTPIWNARFGLAARSLYLPKPEDWSNPRASPLYGDKLKGFWKTFILVASHDALRDDAYGYKAKLEKFGNEVVLVEHTSYHCGDLILNELGIGYNREMELLKEALVKFVGYTPPKTTRSTSDTQ